MKAWHVFHYDDPGELSDVVLAETAGKAKRKSWPFTEYGADFIDLRVRRLPEFDGVAEITDAILYEHGWWVACALCREYVSDTPEEPAVIQGESVYHASCYARLLKGGAHDISSE